MVEWKKLGDICNILDSQRKPVSKGDRKEGVYPYYGANGIQDYVDSFIFDGTYLLMGEDGSVINTDKSPVIHWATGKIWVNNHAHVLEENDSAYLRYIYYSLQCTDVSDLVRGVPPKINQANMRGILIPVPSKNEQKRIVDTLDTFTSSIDNLKQQIAQRRKQYEYYRCCLFSAGKWLEHRIGELTKVFSCPRVFKDQWQDSGIPFWRSSDIMSYHNGVVNPRGEVFISQSLYEELSSKSDRIKEGDILVTGGGSIGIPYLKGDNSPLFVKDADLICIQKCSSIEPKYLYHYFLSTDFKLYLKKITHDATIAHYTINQIKDTPIPLPPLSEQQRIVDILDKFEASIQNLEAQLSQREKQYEYYRNKLLTFD